MPDYRRYFVPGGTYFFTLKTENNAPIFGLDRNVRLLGQVSREMKTKWPVDIVAIVLLSDHLHTIWSLPRGDAAYSTRWGWLKKEFTKRFLEIGGTEQPVSESRIRNRRRGVWQRRFWEHTIEDEEDFEAHFDYIHWNPVKHQYVQRPIDWPHSSFHRWVRKGVYPSNWGCGEIPVGKSGQVVDAADPTFWSAQRTLQESWYTNQCTEIVLNGFPECY